MRTLVIFFTVLLFACSEDKFDAYLIPQGMENLTEVALYPNSPVLIADGKARLTFKVRAYTEVQGHTSVPYYENGKTMVRDSFFMDTAVLNPDRIPEDQIVITTSAGEKINGLTFSTTSNDDEMTFTCRIGKITSQPCTVKLVRPEAPAFVSRVIPVVFHVMYNSDTKSIAEGIDEKYVSETLARLNRVFAGTLAPAPSSLDTKITFIPAEVDKDGNALSEKGISRFNLDEEGLTSWSTYSYITQNLVWDPDRFLNIWLYDEWNPRCSGPAYILDNGTVIEGLNANTVADATLATVRKPEDAGIIIPIASVFSMKNGNGSDRFEFLFGQFFGLKETAVDAYSYDGSDSDYCSDTYVPDRQSVGVLKQTAVVADSGEKPVYFDSFNIMDPYSASTTITYEQALRIRAVIENCPLRMMKQ